MPLDHYLTLGRSALRVSPFCLGTMTFGLDWGWGSDVDDSNAIMDAYIERGGNFLDTANAYTKGHSERIIGDHVGRHPARRDRLVIATKFLSSMHLGDPNSGGAGRKSIIAACEESLRRLQTDYIDLYWMHWLDEFSPIDETMRTLDDLVRAGKVRYLGFSDTPAWKVVQAQYEAIFRSWTPLVALQIEYSLAERSVEHDLIPMARANGLGVTPWSPLKGGVLTGKFTRADVESGDVEKKAGRGAWVVNHMTERNLAIVDALSSVADEAGVTPAQAALCWVQNRPGVASTIIGARTMDQLDANLAALDVTLTDDQVRTLDEVSTPPPVFPYNFLPYTINNTQAGTTINRRPSEAWHMAPRNDDERW
jgi:aryl-alcohol dehydrogenase-like predicted oxidoreductase